MKLVGLRGAAHHAIENVDEIRLGIEAIQFRCVKKRSEYRPGLAPAFVTTEQRVLFSDRNWPDRSLDRVGVRLEPPVIQERRQALPAFEHVVDRLDERRAAGDPVLHRDQTGPQRLHQRLRLGMSRRAAFPSRRDADPLFDRVDGRNALDDLRGEG